MFQIGLKMILFLSKNWERLLLNTAEYTKLLSTESPSPEVLNYTNEVFNNPNRVESYLVTNYSLFNYKIEKIDNDCSIFYTDPNEMVSGLLSNKFISEHLFFDTDKKRYLDSFIDGSKFRSSSGHTLHLLFYYDDFNPLLNCLSANSSKYKCSAIYFKILNISPLLVSKRSCVMPFMIFYSRDFKTNKQQIFENATKKINDLCEKTAIIDNVIYNFNVVAFACDNLGAHELIGMSNFNASHFCRFCIMSKKEVQEIYKPVEDFNRSLETNLQDYQVYCQLANPTIRHINGICGLNLLGSMTNFLPEPFSFVSCISHDLFEKVVPETITTIIARMHRDKLINSDQIYHILNEFSYNRADKQTPINFESIFAGLSASQGRTFARVFLLF